MTDRSPADQPPNQDQIRHWNEVAGPVWVERQDDLDRMIGGFGARRSTARDRRRARACSTSAAAPARPRSRSRAGWLPAARVVGLDVSRPMLDAARRRAAAAAPLPDRLRRGATRRWRRSSAGAFDVVFSRFGVMFFADPVAAFANLRTRAASDRRLAILCLAAAARNPWVAGPMQALAGVLPMPAPPPPGRAGAVLDGRSQPREGRSSAAPAIATSRSSEVEDELAMGDGSVERHGRVPLAHSARARRCSRTRRPRRREGEVDAARVLPGHRPGRLGEAARRHLAGHRSSASESRAHPYTRRLCGERSGSPCSSPSRPPASPP